MTVSAEAAEEVRSAESSADLLGGQLNGQLVDHLGYEKHDPAGAGSGNSRNGVRFKTVLTDIGPVEVTVPRDRNGNFEPQIVTKRQRRLIGVGEMVLSPSACGLTDGDISAHLTEAYGASVSEDPPDAISASGPMRSPSPVSST